MAADVSVLAESDFERWNDYVAAHPRGTAFHTTTWLRHVGADPKVLTVREGDTILGGVALVRTRKFGLDAFHVPPYTPFFGPLLGAADTEFVLPEARHQQLTRDLLAALPPAGVHDFRLSPGHVDPLPFRWAGFEVGVGVTYRIRPGGAAEPQLGASKRRYVKKLLAEQEAGRLLVRWDVGLDRILRLWDDTAERRRFRARGDALRRALHGIPPTWVRSLLVSTPDEVDLTVGVCVLDAGAAYYLVNASRAPLDGLLGHANTLAVYLMARDILSKGLTFDFEGSSVSGIAQFYNQMGGQQVPVYRAERTRSVYYGALRAGLRHRQARSAP